MANINVCSGNNTAFGHQVMQTTAGGYNTGVVAAALFSNVFGSDRIGIGYIHQHKPFQLQTVNISWNS
ncbi:MAG: hypothetical protein IPN49_09250 [Saprospiraceae bacterium]|nr:hypothetical protein [Saprospiraceae bacterium]